MELTFKKVSADKSFMAYHLNQFAILECRSIEDVADYLNCNAEQLYKLGLSKAPETHAADYSERINRICDYVGIQPNVLNALLLQVAQLEHHRKHIQQKTLEQILFANWQHSNHGLIKNTLKIATSVENYLSAWHGKIPARLYKGGLAILCLVFFIFLSRTKVDDKAIYATTTPETMDQYRYIAAADKTFVYT